jgi:hypothetical protein
MTDEDTINEPGPTVVGPQPAERDGGRRIPVPRGLEKLVALAGVSPEWRERVLADPLAAAGEAELELSESERAIVSSIPRHAFEQMVESFAGKAPRPKGIKRMAAGAAAAALLATALTGCGDDRGPAPTGSRPDVPPAKPATPEPAPPATKGSRPDLPKSSAPKAKSESGGEAAKSTDPGLPEKK